MPTVSAGSSSSYTFTGSQTITFTFDPGEAATFLITRDGKTIAGSRATSGQTIGPYQIGDVAVIEAQRGNIDYLVADFFDYSDPLQTFVDGDTSELVEPFVIAHRCGGLLAPECCYEALDVGASLQGNYIGIDLDFRASSDGIPYWIHDDTVTRLTTLTGFVNSFTSWQLRRAVKDASAYFGLNASDEVGLLTPEDIFPYYRGRARFSVEPKDTASALYLADYLAGLGMQQQVFFNTFTDAHGPIFTSRGFTKMVGRNVAAIGEHTTLAGTGGAARIAALKALGFTHLILDYADPNYAGAAAACAANGMKFGVYTSSTSILIKQFQYDQLLALNPRPAFAVSEDPVYFSRDYANYRRTTDAWRTGYVYHGQHNKSYAITPGPQARGALANSRLVLSPSSAANDFHLVPGVGPIAQLMTGGSGSATITGTIVITTATPGDRTRWPGVVVCSPDDQPFSDSGVASTGFVLGVQPSTATGGGANGQMFLRKKVQGVDGTGTMNKTVSLGLEITTFPATLTYTIAITPTSIVATLTSGGSGTPSITITAAEEAANPVNGNTSLRGPYPHVGYAANASGGVFEHGPFTVT